MLAKTNNQPVNYSTQRKSNANRVLSQGYRVLSPEIPVGLCGGQLLPPAVPRIPKKKQPFPSAPRGWLPIPQLLSFRAPSPHLTLLSLRVESRFLPETFSSLISEKGVYYNPYLFRTGSLNF